MTSKKTQICLVSQPSNAGAAAIEHNFVWLLEQFLDVELFQFGISPADLYTKYEPLFGERVSRIMNAPQLVRKLSQCRNQVKPVLMYGLSPVSHSLPFTLRYPDSISAFVDWTRTIGQEYLEGQAITIKENMIGALHQAGLAKLETILCPTKRIAEHLIARYGVPSEKIAPVTMPIDLDLFNPADRANTIPNEKPRILFVGLDLKRKAGDLLLDWFVHHGQGRCDLTMVTNHSDPQLGLDGLKWRSAMVFGSEDQLNTYRSHDIVCLPSRFDSYGFAIAEGAACGAAVVTTESTLGHIDVVQQNYNGLVAKSPEGCISDLDRLLTNPELLSEMQHHARVHMERVFAANRIFDQFVEGLPKLKNAMRGD